MDDALSMVDTRTEERILNQILESRKGKTNLIVSHRISTISRAEVIVVLVDGELAETGEHQTLLQKGKEYARLYERQRLEQELEIEPGMRNNWIQGKGVMEYWSNGVMGLQRTTNTPVLQYSTTPTSGEASYHDRRIRLHGRRQAGEAL